MEAICLELSHSSPARKRVCSCRTGCTLGRSRLGAILCRDPASDNLKNLAAAGDPQGGVAFHLLAERRVAGIVLHGGLKAANTFGLVFQDDAVEVTGEVGQDAVLAEFGGGCGFL